MRLKPDAVSVAEELKREFGNMVEITVGFKPFPEVTSSASPPALQARGSLPMIRATCQVDAKHMHGGDTVSGKVVIRNTGDSDIEAFGSAGAGWLCRPGTSEVVGGYSGPIGGVGHVLQLGRGGTERLPFVVGAASCERGGGYVVPAGRYEVVVPVTLDIKGHASVRILARACFIEVT